LKKVFMKQTNHSRVIVVATALVFGSGFLNAGCGPKNTDSASDASKTPPATTTDRVTAPPPGVAPDPRLKAAEDASTARLKAGLEGKK